MLASMSAKNSFCGVKATLQHRVAIKLVNGRQIGNAIKLYDSETSMIITAASLSASDVFVLASIQVPSGLMATT